MFYGASLGGASGLNPVLQPAAPLQIPVESALLRGARLAAAVERVADVPGSEDPDYEVKGPFFGSDRVLVDGVSLRYQFDAKQLWNPGCKCPRGALWADNILAFATHQRSLFALAEDKSVPPKDDRLAAIATKAWTDEFNAAAIKAVVAAFLRDGAKPDYQGMPVAAKIAHLVKANVPLVSWDYFDGLVKELYADHASCPLEAIKIIPRSLAPAENAYIKVVLASSDVAFDAWGDDRPVQPVETPGAVRAREAAIQAILLADQHAQQQAQAQALQAQAQLQQQQQAQLQQQQQAQAQAQAHAQAVARAHVPLQTVPGIGAGLNPFAFTSGVYQLPMQMPLNPFGVPAQVPQPGHPLPPLKPYEKCVSKLTEALTSGGFFWPPTYRAFAMERLWMAATKSDSTRLALGPNNSIITQDDAWSTKEREGAAAIEDFREGFEFVLSHMAAIGMDQRVIDDRRAWLRFWMNDIKSLSPTSRLKAAESFILRHSSSPNWMSCIGSNPTLWIRAASDSLPDSKRNNHNDSGNHNANKVGKNNARNRKRKLKNKNAGRGADPSRSRSRSSSPPAKKATTPKQGAPSNGHPNRVAGVCDSRTHKRGCSAENNGRKCPLSHDCPRCAGQDHSMRDCPKA
jgi:hypothetical protein